jgi:hypothetical protein
MGKSLDTLSIQEKQVELARAVVDPAIFYGDVQLVNGEWVISASRPARAGAPVILHLGNGPEEAIEFRSPQFSSALRAAVESGAAPAQTMDRYTRLLESFGLALF